MASNDWFGKMKKHAQTFQETAKTKLDKLSETVDKKMKEVQEDREKQRTKTELDQASTLLVWRSRSDNPDGEIVTSVKSIPSPSASSTERKEASGPPAILAAPEPILPVTPTAEIQQATPPPADPVEEIIVVSRKSKGKKSSTKHTDNQAETTNTNKDANKETVEQKPENKRTNDQTDMVSTIFEMSEDASVKPTLTQEVSSRSEKNANQENIQQVISNDTLVANVDDGNKSIEQFNQENTSVNELNPETLETNQNQLLATENLQSTDAVTAVPITPTNDVQNTDVENSFSEDVHNSTNEPKAETTFNEIVLDEPSTLTHDNQLSIESTNAENTDKETSVTETSTVITNDRVALEDSVLVNEPTTSTGTDKFIEEHPVREDPEKELSHDNYIQENIQNNVSKEELTSASNDNLIPDNILVEEPSVQENISIDEPTLSTNTEELIEEYPTLEDQQNEVSNDDHISVDKSITSTPAVQLTEEQLVPEDIHKELSYDNQICEYVSVVEHSTLTNTDQLAKEYPVLGNTQKDVPNKELTNTTDDSFISENLPDGEPLISTNTEQSTEKQGILEADLISEITANDESVTEQPVSENTYDELTTETIDNRSWKENVQDESFIREETSIIQLKDELQIEPHLTENINKVPSDDDDAVPVETTTPENIQVNEPVDALSIDNTDSSSVNSQPENISPDTLNDDFVFPTKSDEIPVDNFETNYIQLKTHDDLVSTDTQSDVEIIPIDIEPESITNIGPVESKSENLPAPKLDVIVSPIESAPAVKEEVKKSVEKPNAKDVLVDDVASDDELKAITNTAIKVVPLSSSSVEEVSHVLPIPSVPTATYGINPFDEIDESIETNPFGDVDEATDQTNPFGEDEDDTNPFNEVGQSASNNPCVDDTNTTSSTTITRTVQPRSSVINYHPIPPGTKISQMNCSSLYIYFCTIGRKLFFAKLNFSDPSQPFDWQQHGESAERLVASVSNRTVWRFFNQCIYIANDPINHPPFGSYWNTIKIDDDESLLSMSVSDQCGWYIKKDGTLWFLRTDDKTLQSTNIPCSYTLDIVSCFSEKVGVTTNIGEILIRVGCTSNFPEGDGWLFIEKRVGFIDDFILLTNNDIMMIMDKKHRLWMNEWSTKTDFHEILLSDDFDTTKKRYLLGVNTKFLYITDCEKGIYVYSDAITGVQWNIAEQSSPYLRLFAAFSGEDYVWAITSSRLIGSSAGQILDKPDAVGAFTHASFVPNTSSKKSILWALDQSCDIYIRSNIEKDTIWEQPDDSQFEKKRKLLNIVCNNSGVWAVDDRGNIYFRHGHISANQYCQSKESSLLPPAWITVPGDAKRSRSFVQVFCGPADWMVYATDTKQNVYTRIGISTTDRVGTAWKLIEDCSALELAISGYNLWLLTSHGHIECRENISVENSIGTRSVTLSGHFRSLTVSSDDSQVWALDSKRDLLKLDRLTVLFKK